MRISCAGLFLSAMGLFLTVVGSIAAQDTNFSTGPQYLAIQGSPLFARPISTPSLSLETQMEEPMEHEATAEPPIESAVPPAEAQADQPPYIDFFTFYYALPIAGNAAQSMPESGLDRAVLPQGSESIFESGVSELLDAQAIRRLGSGASLAEEAARWKGRKIVPARTYTNEDIERLRQGS
jgi:hypothetical protein